MQVGQILNPLNVVDMGPLSQGGQGYNPYDETTPAPEPQPNPYNDHADGWLTRNLSAGFLSQQPIKLILQGNGAGAQGIDAILKNPHIKAAGRTTGLSAAIYTGLSIFQQGAGLARGEQSGGGAAANIITDAVRGTGAGLGAYAGGSLSAVAMRAFGVTGTLGTIVSTVGAMYGATVGAEIVEATGLRGSLLSALDGSAA